MRILLIAPEQPRITIDTELRDISGMHTVHTYIGQVHLDQLYQACQRFDYEIIHIIDHNIEGEDRDGESVIPLSGDDVLIAQDLVDLAQSAGPGERAAGLFLNTCNSSYYAAYCTRRGVPWVIFTTLALWDRTGWKAPLRFYGALAEMEKAKKVDLYEAYLSIPADGLYGFSAGMREYHDFVLAPVIDRLTTIDKRMNKLGTLVETMDREGTTGSRKRIAASRRRDWIKATIGMLLLFGLTIAVNVYFFYWILSSAGN